MIVPAYTKDILRLAASLDAPHDLARSDGRAELRAPTCGSTIATAVMLTDGRVVDLSQGVSACAFGQASAALVAAHAKGRSGEEVARALGELGDWLTGARADPGGWPGLATLEPARARSGRHGAILLPFRALLAAIEDGRQG
ncbi:MAG: iron-sulfur cluster assembly scaffold protein [Sphingomicrobium sp.]